jgi:hypothetical protein
VKKIGVINDLHVPFHNVSLVDLVLYIFKDIGIDELWINGDFWDFYCLNFYSKKHPVVKEDLDSEIEAGLELLESIRKMFPNNRIVFISGNHELRYDRWMVQNATAFYNRISLEKEINDRKLNIELHPYNTAVQVYNTNLKIQHSPPSYSVNGARASIMKKVDCSYIWGCTHRIDMAVIKGDSGRMYRGYFNGWLGDKVSTESHRQVFSYTKDHANWQECFSIVYLADDLVHYDVHQVIIEDGSCVVEGTRYVVED